MTVARRLLRARVLETLERRARQFRSREELWPLRVPREPVLLDDVIEEALGEERRGFDPITLRSRTLLRLEWGPQNDAAAGAEPSVHDPAAIWDAWVIVLPSRVKLYCDSDPVESRVLASGGPNAGNESDRVFLELLAQSGGEHFGIEMSGGAPSRVRSSLSSRELLIEFFVNLFEVTQTEHAVRDALAGRGPARSSDDGQGTDFRSEVDRWLEVVMR